MTIKNASRILTITLYETATQYVNQTLVSSVSFRDNFSKTVPEITDFKNYHYTTLHTSTTLKSIPRTHTHF